MSCPNPSIQTKTAALLFLIFGVLGCGKEPTSPKDDVIDSQRAEQVALRVADTFRGTSAIEFGRLLFLPSPSSMKSGSGRVSKIGTLTGDDTQFLYEIAAFDASGDTVAWESTAWDKIERVLVTWRMRFDLTDTEGPSYWHYRSHGSYDVSGLRPSVNELAFSGSSRDTSDYHWALPNAEAAGRGTWLVAVEGLRWSKDWENRPYPLTGREVYVVDAQWTTAEGSNHQAVRVQARVVITYNGTRFATLIVDAHHVFRLDLETGDIVSPAAQ